MGSRVDRRRRIPTLIGVPYEGGASLLRGTAKAPPLIRRALFSPGTNLWTEALVDLEDPSTLEDMGDISIPEGGDVQHAIEVGVTRLLAQEKVPVILGGDHSITHPILRAIRRAYSRLSLLHFDAHPDLYSEFKGDPYSHACPFARIMEEKLVDQLVQVGIRTMNGHQREQADRFGVEVITMAAWAQGQRFALRAPTYLSIDLDALDPAFAPGVSHREPGGLSVREIITAIQGIDVPLVGADIVEFNPDRDPVELTAPVCAKLVKEIVAKMVGAPQIS